VADQSVVTTALHRAWNELLPGHRALGEDLLERWSQSSRSYHGVEHLTECLAALRFLGSSHRTEHMALWFHDAVHTNTPGTDELRSAELAETLLRSILPPAEVTEVSRLIRLTVDHAPLAGDTSGARVCDADLAVLAAPPARYLASVTQLRAEAPTLSADEWAQARLARLEQLLASDPLFHSPIARRAWTSSALSNLQNEFQQLKSPRHRP
jgi:predicted metal-dependent HD superfamily phosphohydrolase